MIGRYEYPCLVEVGAVSGFQIQFPDIPEAINGAERLSELEHRAIDALVTALNFCVEAGEPLPVPSIAAENQTTISVPPVVAAKLALYETMLDQGISRAYLAQRLDRDAAYINRLLDLHSRCQFEQIIPVLALLGRRVVVTVQPAA